MTLLITGGNGFLGRNLARAYAARGVVPKRPTRAQYDLRVRSAVCDMFDDLAPHTVIHCAATVAGIGGNRAHPATYLYDNVVMGMNVIDEAAKRGLPGTFVLISSACAYPADAPVPTRETDLWSGFPEPTNAPYGVAKRTLGVALDAARAQYGLKSVTFIPANLYGVGDNFDPATSHVIPAMVRKFVDAVGDGACEVELWGDGSAARDFLHVEDAARGIVDILNLVRDQALPINLGSGHAYRIDSVARMVAEAAGFHGKITWRRDMPNGQRYRLLDTTQAAGFGWAPERSFVHQLIEMVRWYRTSKRALT